MSALGTGSTIDSVYRTITSTRRSPGLTQTALTIPSSRLRVQRGQQLQVEYGMSVGHDPRVVANALIARAHDQGIPIWNVSVQKLLYFAHAAFLVHYHRPLIRGAFEAWEYGPVCRPIYDALKGYGRSEITAPIKRRDPFTGEISSLPSLDDAEALGHIQHVMRVMGQASPGQLITLSHVPGGAWSIVWNKAKTGATVGNRIDDELTKSTFGKLKVALAPSQPHEGLDEATPFAGD